MACTLEDSCEGGVKLVIGLLDMHSYIERTYHICEACYLFESVTLYSQRLMYMIASHVTLAESASSGTGG